MRRDTPGKVLLAIAGSLLVGWAVTGAFVGGGAGSSPRTTADAQVGSAHPVDAYGRLPLAFVEGTGSTRNFVAHGPGLNVLLGEGGARLRLSHERREATIGLTFVGAGRATPTARQRLPGVMNYLVGPRSRWRTKLSMFGGVVYPDVWRGIDAAFHGDSDGLEYDFVVSPVCCDPAGLRRHTRTLAGEGRQPAHPHPVRRAHRPPAGRLPNR